MNAASFHDQTQAIGTYVDMKIRALQVAYLNNKTQSAAHARAALSQLRRLDTSAYSPWMSIGNQLFTGWPEQILGTPNEYSKALLAVKAALQLYAYHQQSETTPMDVIIDGGTEDERRKQRLRGAFGRACRRINPDLDTSAGVRRRLGSIESASDFDGVKRNMRALILLLKSSSQINPQDYQIDYRALAEDLYRLQFDSVRDSVFLRWGREYFTASPESGTKSSTTTENEPQEIYK